MTAFQAEGCGLPLCGNAYKVSVTGLAFFVIWHDKHYGNQPPPVAFPLWCLMAPPSRPAGKRVTRFSGRFAPLRIVFPCHRGIGRATKGKRLYGQARRLTSPDLHILCRMCTVDNKTLKSGPRIKFPCHCKGTQGRYGIYLPVSSGKWRSAKVSFLGAASFTWAAYVHVFVLSFL